MPRMADRAVLPKRRHAEGTCSTEVFLESLLISMNGVAQKELCRSLGLLVLFD